MELHTPDWTVAVFDGHGYVVTLGGNEELSAYSDTDKRMIAPDLHRAFELSEDALAPMSDQCGFSMHDLASPAHSTAEVMDNALMSQADSEDRQMFWNLVQEGKTKGGILRSSRTRRHEQEVRLLLFDVGKGLVDGPMTAIYIDYTVSTPKLISQDVHE